MKNKMRIIYGISCILIGFVAFVLFVDYRSKPSNIPLSFTPIESFETYYFFFVYTLGKIGWFIGSVLLLVYLVFLYYVGRWIFNKANVKK